MDDEPLLWSLLGTWSLHWQRGKLVLTPRGDDEVPVLRADLKARLALVCLRVAQPHVLTAVLAELPQWGPVWYAGMPQDDGTVLVHARRPVTTPKRASAAEAARFRERVLALEELLGLPRTHSAYP